MTHVRANADAHADRPGHGHPPAVRDGRGPRRSAGEMRGTRRDRSTTGSTANGAGAGRAGSWSRFRPRPAWSDGELVPRPMTPARLSRPHAATAGRSCPAALRASAPAPTPRPSPCSAAARPPTSGSSADSPVPDETHAARPQPRLHPQPRPAACRSRAADNLFWLGRYVERAEGAAAAARAYNARLAEAADAAPLLRRDRATISTRSASMPKTPLPPGLIAHARPAPSTPPAASATASRSMAGWR